MTALLHASPFLQWICKISTYIMGKTTEFDRKIHYSGIEIGTQIHLHCICPSPSASHIPSLLKQKWYGLHYFPTAISTHNRFSMRHSIYNPCSSFRMRKFIECMSRHYLSIFMIKKKPFSLTLFPIVTPHIQPPHALPSFSHTPLFSLSHHKWPLCAFQRPLKRKFMCAVGCFRLAAIKHQPDEY